MVELPVELASASHRKRICRLAEGETTLTAKSNEARARAEASFRKEERAKEGAKAMTEYYANVDGRYDPCGLIGRRRAACTGFRQSVSGSHIFNLTDSPDRAGCLIPPRFACRDVSPSGCANVHARKFIH